MAVKKGEVTGSVGCETKTTVPKNLGDLRASEVKPGMDYHQGELLLQRPSFFLHTLPDHL